MKAHVLKTKLNLHSHFKTRKRNPNPEDLTMRIMKTIVQDVVFTISLDRRSLITTVSVVVARSVDFVYLNVNVHLHAKYKS